VIAGQDCVADHREHELISGAVRDVSRERAAAVIDPVLRAGCFAPGVLRIEFAQRAAVNRSALPAIGSALYQL